MYCDNFPYGLFILCKNQYAKSIIINGRLKLFLPFLPELSLLYQFMPKYILSFIKKKQKKTEKYGNVLAIEPFFFIHQQKMDSDICGLIEIKLN